MSLGTVVSLMRGGVFEILLLSAPILLVALIVGLVVAIFQATTSIQEQTLDFRSENNGNTWNACPAWAAGCSRSSANIPSICLNLFPKWHADS